MKKLGFGLMRLPLTDPKEPTSIDLDLFKKMADMYIDRGFVYFDTAYPYHNGTSEIAFREAVAKRYDRSKFILTDKMPCWLVEKEDDLERIFNEQLERTGVEYFDYYWLHCMNKRYVEIMDSTHGWDFIRRKQAEGYIKNIGFSFHDDSPTLEAILKNHSEMDFVQLQINYVDWDSPTIEGGECYRLCEKYGKKVIVMEPVKGGSLANVPQPVADLFASYNPKASPASWAIRYAASLPNVIMVLSGMSNLEQVADNTAYMADFVPLNSDEQRIIEQATDIIQRSIDIPCTACHYCTDGCPQGIAIPEYFSILNMMKQLGEDTRSNSQYYYNLLIKDHGKASDCVECGQCESHCPQHLHIMDNLKRVAATLE